MEFENTLEDYWGKQKRQLLLAAMNSMSSIAQSPGCNRPMREEHSQAENTTMRGCRLAGLITIRRWEGKGPIFVCSLHLQSPDNLQPVWSTITLYSLMLLGQDSTHRLIFSCNTSLLEKGKYIFKYALKTFVD